jgi:hypothetical protein
MKLIGSRMLHLNVTQTRSVIRFLNTVNYALKRSVGNCTCTTVHTTQCDIIAYTHSVTSQLSVYTPYTMLITDESILRRTPNEKDKTTTYPYTVVGGRVVTSRYSSNVQFPINGQQLMMQLDSITRTMAGLQGGGYSGE